jgi:hypothetical protein
MLVLADPAQHYHPAVHLAVSVNGPMHLAHQFGGPISCRVAVIGAGTRHALRAETTSKVLSIYLGLETAQGIALNALASRHSDAPGL